MLLNHLSVNSKVLADLIRVIDAEIQDNRKSRVFIDRILHLRKSLLPEPGAALSYPAYKKAVILPGALAERVAAAEGPGVAHKQDAVGPALLQL